MNFSYIIEQLDAIGFPWEADVKVKQDKWFIPFYEKLIKYKEAHDGFSGMTQDPSISSTVVTVHKLYKNKEFHRLTQEMIDMLDEIGFPWEVEYGNWFDPFYEKLIEYKKLHNGTFYGATHDKEIGLKVSSVRKAYKGKGQYRLTQEMIDKLNAIDFPWVAQPKKIQENDLTV